MTTDTIAKIKAAERDAAALVEKERQNCAEKLRLAKAGNEERLREESEKLRRKFDEGVAEAQNEADSNYDEEEVASFSEAEKFTKNAETRLPDAVRFIVGGIIGKWQ